VKHTGKIRWFDSKSGEGMVRGDNGLLYYVHFTAIKGMDKNNYHWPTQSDQVKFSCISGLSCEFDVIEDTTFVQVSSLRLVDDVETPAVYLGRVLWFDERDGYGIVVDIHGNENYVDVSVTPNRASLKRDQLVSFEINPKIADCRCGHRIQLIA
jgi:cold shock CspA family protein